MLITIYGLCMFWQSAVLMYVMVSNAQRSIVGSSCQKLHFSYICSRQLPFTKSCYVWKCLKFNQGSTDQTFFLGGLIHILLLQFMLFLVTLINFWIYWYIKSINETISIKPSNLWHLKCYSLLFLSLAIQKECENPFAIDSLVINQQD